MEENIKAFVSHNYITDSEKRMKIQLFVVSSFMLIFSLFACYISSTGYKRIDGSTGITEIDILFIIYAGIILLLLFLVIQRIDRSPYNTRFIKLQFAYNCLGCINIDICITYMAYKMIGGEFALAGIAYQIVLIVVALYLANYKHEKWIREGEYKNYSDVIAKWDRLHTKIWHKDSYYSVIAFGIILVLGRLSKSVAVLIYACFSIKAIIIIDIVKCFLQLKYAKKYNLVNYLPQAPNKNLEPH